MAEITFFSLECLQSQIDGNAVAPEIFQSNESLGHWLRDRYHGKTPIPFEIYEGDPCCENLVFKSPEVVLNCHGKYTVMESPGDPATIAYVALAVVAAVAVIALTPDPVVAQNINRSQESPNNRLTGRTNDVRILQRVPDIRGTDKSYPDVAMPSYNIFVDDIEEEHAYYCVGRKFYEFETMSDNLTPNIKDGDTPIALIDGASAGIYIPETNPNDDAPSQQIGDDIIRDVVAPFRSNEVNGDKISISRVVIDSNDVVFYGSYNDGSGDQLRLRNAFWSVDAFPVGSEVLIVDTFAVKGITSPTDVSGTYTVKGNPGTSKLILDSNFFPWEGEATTIPGDGTVESTFVSEVPFKFMTKEVFEKIIINIVAPGGMYKDSGGANYLTTSVDFNIDYQLIDSSGNDIGSEITVASSIQGNTNNVIGKTVEIILPYSSRFKARVVRTSQKVAFNGAVSDEVVWDKLYAINQIQFPASFPFTTIQTKTISTPRATSLKQRKINGIVTEMVDKYLGSGVFDGFLTPNESPFQSFISDAIDPNFGNRPLSEIDADGIIALDSEVSLYFGRNTAQFNYTIDTTDLTFQEYAYMIFNAAFCIPYRANTSISAFFDGPQISPAMLFTHRSKVPGAEIYTRQPPSSKDYDGVDFVWFNPNESYSSQSIIESDIANPVNLKRVEISGIKDEIQAILRAKREWNRLKFSRLQLDLTVTAEGRYTRIGEMISVVKGSRIHTQDGEVIATNGLELTLSQEVDVSAGGPFSIFLKDDTGVPESRAVSPGSAANKVVISSATTSPIRTGISSRRTEFSIGTDSRLDAQRWIPQEVDIGDKYTVAMQCINYAEEYYQDDNIDLLGFDDGFDDGFGV